MYRWTVFIGFLFGLACRPADSLIARLVARFLEGHQSCPGGLVSLARWLGLFAWFWLWFMSNCESATLLVTRLGLMPCSAWSKKNTFGIVREFLESRPDKFLVTPTTGRGYRVALVKQECDTPGKANYGSTLVGSDLGCCFCVVSLPG